MSDDVQNAVGEWASITFPLHTIDTIRLHFLKEVKELNLAIGNREGMGSDAATVDPADIARISEESADCVMLLMHLAHRLGFSLASAIDAKFEIVQARRWGEPDADGVVEHIRDDA